MAEAFRTFAVDPPYEVRQLRQLLIKRAEELAGQLGAGYCNDWPDYQKRIGVIEGISEAIAACEEMEKQER